MHEEVRMANDLGRLILRLVLGIAVLLHGIGKLTGGVWDIANAQSAAWLPSFLACGVSGGEVIEPIQVLLGFFARSGAWLIVINMLVAIGLVHMHQSTALNAQGG